MDENEKNDFTPGSKALIERIVYRIVNEVVRTTLLSIPKMIADAIRLHQAECPAARQTEQILEKLNSVEAQLREVRRSAEESMAAARDVKSLVAKVAAVSSVIGTAVGVAAHSMWVWLIGST